MPPLGSYRHVVTVQNPAAAVPDGDGGYIEGWADATPGQLHCSITPASTNDLERLTAGTITSTATHLVRARWHKQITTASRLLFHGRILNVIYVGNPDERSLEVVLVCAEMLDSSPAAAGVPPGNLSGWDTA